MNYTEIARAFGLEIENDDALESLYAYAPVFKVAAQDGVWVLKRSQKPISRARSRRLDKPSGRAKHPRCYARARLWRKPSRFSE